MQEKASSSGISFLKELPFVFFKGSGSLNLMPVYSSRLGGCVIAVGSIWIIFVQPLPDDSLNIPIGSGTHFYHKM